MEVTSDTANPLKHATADMKSEYVYNRSVLPLFLLHTYQIVVLKKEGCVGIVIKI